MVYGSTRPHNKTYVNQNINTTTDTTLLSPSRFTNLKNKIAHAVMSSQLFFFRLAVKGDIKRNIHRIHTTTCECVPQSLCDMLHSSNIWILSHFPSSASATPFRKISRKYSPQGIRHLLWLCLQGKLNRKCSFCWEDQLDWRSMGLWRSTSAWGGSRPSFPKQAIAAAIL